MDQLENMLFALAEASPEHGLTILHHLLGLIPNQQLGMRVMAQFEEVPFSFSLLSKLCEPTSEVNKQRY